MRPRRGFTLLEVVLAAFVFAVGVLALEAAAINALRQMRRSADLTLAADVARARLETLASSRCSAVQSGTDTVRSVVSAWTVAPAAGPVREVTQVIRYPIDGDHRTWSLRTSFRCSE